MKGFLKMMGAAVLTVALFGLAPRVAQASVASYEVSTTMALGTSSTAVTIPLVGSEIKDVIVWCPTMDDGTTVGVALTLNLLDKTGLAPRGWTDKEIGATSDNALVQCNSSALEIYCDNTATVTITTMDNQAAARAFKVLFLVKH